MYGYETVQSALKSSDIQLIERANEDLLKQIDASNTTSTDELLAAIDNTNSGLARNFGAEIFIPGICSTTTEKVYSDKVGILYLYDSFIVCLANGCSHIFYLVFTIKLAYYCAVGQDSQRSYKPLLLFYIVYISNMPRNVFVKCFVDVFVSTKPILHSYFHNNKRMYLEISGL